MNENIGRTAMSTERDSGFYCLKRQDQLWAVGRYGGGAWHIIGQRGRHSDDDLESAGVSVGRMVGPSIRG